jgi:hypothetical protein
MYKIAEAKGIKGCDNSIVKPILEEVDINPMLCRDEDELPTMRNKIVGRTVTKQSYVIEEDGTKRYSSPCTVSYNAWERCLEDWFKEERWTEGYTIPPKYGKYKYDNKFKRKLHFQGELKFAQAKAETKAYEKTIRELAGLMTGYATQDLQSGKLTFAKVRRSKEDLNLERAARLQAISKGNEPESLLFEPEPEPEQADDPVQVTFSPEPESKPGPEPEKKSEPEPVSLSEQLTHILRSYLSESMVPEQFENAAGSIVEWLSSGNNLEDNETAKNKAIKILKDIETTIPEQGRFEHEIY